MPDSNVVSLNGHKFELVAKTQLPEGVRGWTRAVRASQESDPGVPKRARWIPSGPFGLSQETPEGFLGHDYSDGCETRYDGLVTVAAKEVAVALDDLDPVEGEMTLPFTPPLALGGFATANTSHIIQDRRFLIFGRGQAVTVVDPSDMSLVATYAKGGAVEGMTVWKNHGVISYGSLLDMEKVGEISADGASFVAVSGVRAKSMTVGDGRWWGVKAAADGTDENKLFFSQDDLSTFSNAFTVGDDKIPATGIGTAGPYVAVGNEVGASSFTDLGKAQRLLEAVKDFRAEENGRSIDTLWGWTYIATKSGLFAVPLPSLIANPVGPEAYTNFDGAIDGYPTAVKAWKDSLWVAYLTTSGDTYILRGMFGEQTAVTGRPTWYPFAKLSNTQCDVIGGTAERTNPTLIVGTGNTASYFTLGRRGRDIDDGNYRFATAGTWYGTRMMREPGMLKSPRYWLIYTEDCSATKTVRLDVSVNGGAYVTVGTISSSGQQFIRPVSAGVPLTTVSGSTHKIRLVFANDSDTAPPRVIGPIDMAYDERPDTIEEHRFVVRIKGRKDWDEATALFGTGDSAKSPCEVYLPGEGTKRYGMLVALDELRDIGGDAVQAAIATVHLWDVA